MAESYPKGQMKAKQRTEHFVSAGGVVYRISDGASEVALCGRIAPPLWGLPKGTPGRGETREQTAIREVQEETGLKVKIEDFIDKIEYWFVRPPDGVRCHKVVYFYLMSPTGGDVSLHDHEFDVVQWFPVEEAKKALTYENEVRIVEKGVLMGAQKARIG
jgi:8-oxo-dGTP pyrophosphatase MutT (NUDIX family)